MVVELDVAILIGQLIFEFGSLAENLLSLPVSVGGSELVDNSHYKGYDSWRHKYYIFVVISDRVRAT